MGSDHTQELQQIQADNNGQIERANWLLNSPDPPGTLKELFSSVKEIVLPHQKSKSKQKSPSKIAISVLNGLFPILKWSRNYRLSMFKHDLLAGLTLASLSIPQSIGYANLAKLDPQYGLCKYTAQCTLYSLNFITFANCPPNLVKLHQFAADSGKFEMSQNSGARLEKVVKFREKDTSVAPPLIYSIMGSSREIAIGPVAVVSLLISSMVSPLLDPTVDPVGYRKLVFMVTFFAGIFQFLFGLLRLGFLVDFLSHAALVGFMGGAAIVIGLQQLKGLLGISHFTTKTDVVSVLHSVFTSLKDDPWNPLNFVLGTSFLIFLLIARFIGRNYKKLFWFPAIAPLLSVILSTLIVFLTKADKHGVKIVKHIKGGLNPISIQDLQFKDQHIGELAKIGLITAIIALTEAIAVGRSFASIKGYHLDGNKEMVAMGFMNVAGSFTSCYVATGSFSRTAVNFSAGCETVISNIVMAITVILSLELFTKLLYYTPMAILASIILSALPGLINIQEAYHIWKIDKIDFLACIGAFFGVLFVSIEIGLLVAVGISFGKILLNSIRPGIEEIGRIPRTEDYGDINQYPMAITTPGILTVRFNSPLLCFANANFIRDRIMRWVIETQQEDQIKENKKGSIEVVILDMSCVTNIDTAGILALEELHKKLLSHETELVVASPRWQVMHKLKLSKFLDKIGMGRIFFSVGEAVDARTTTKLDNFNSC